MIWKTPCLVFAVDQLAVDLHVEDTALAFDQFAIKPKTLLDVCRQTDGCRLIVSLHAVFDRNVHRVFSKSDLRVSRLQSPCLHQRIPSHSLAT